MRIKTRKRQNFQTDVVKGIIRTTCVYEKKKITSRPVASADVDLYAYLLNC